MNYFKAWDKIIKTNVHENVKKKKKCFMRDNLKNSQLFCEAYGWKISECLAFKTLSCMFCKNKRRDKLFEMKI